jgi:hypothetical protein
LSPLSFLKPITCIKDLMHNRVHDLSALLPIKLFGV